LLFTCLAVHIELHSDGVITFADVRQIPSCVKHIEEYRAGRRNFGLSSSPGSAIHSKGTKSPPESFRPGEWRTPSAQSLNMQPAKRSVSLSSSRSHNTLVKPPPVIRLSPAASRASSRHITRAPRTSVSTYPSVCSPQRESAHLPAVIPPFRSGTLQPQTTGDSDWRRSATTVWSQESAVDNHRSLVPPLPVFPQRWRVALEQRERERDQQRADGGGNRRGSLDTDSSQAEPSQAGSSPSPSTSPPDSSQLEPSPHHSSASSIGSAGPPPPLPPKDGNLTLSGVSDSTPDTDLTVALPRRAEHTTANSDDDISPTSTAV
jgi:hypothetical protein